MKIRKQKKLNEGLMGQYLDKHPEYSGLDDNPYGSWLPEPSEIVEYIMDHPSLLKQMDPCTPSGRDYLDTWLSEQGLEHHKDEVIAQLKQAMSCDETSIVVQEDDATFEDDGWDCDEIRDSGLMEALRHAINIDYIIRNCNRSAASFGDTLEDLKAYVNEVAEELKDAVVDFPGEDIDESIINESRDAGLSLGDFAKYVELEADKVTLVVDDEKAWSTLHFDGEWPEEYFDCQITRIEWPKIRQEVIIELVSPDGRGTRDKILEHDEDWPEKDFTVGVFKNGQLIERFKTFDDAREWAAEEYDIGDDDVTIEDLYGDECYADFDPNADARTVPGKYLSENTKVKLTIGQLKRLIKKA